MDDNAKLELHVDTSQIVSAMFALNELTKAANRAADAIARLRETPIRVVAGD